jgi:hypothetical protein
MRKGGGQWGAAVLGGEEGEEVRQLHGVGGGQHSEEWHGRRGGQRPWLTCGGQR